MGNGYIGNNNRFVLILKRKIVRYCDYSNQGKDIGSNCLLLVGRSIITRNSKFRIPTIFDIHTKQIKIKLGFPNKIASKIQNHGWILNEKSKYSNFL